MLERLGIRGLGNDGWSYATKDILGQFKGQLYTARRRFAAAMDELLDFKEADIYGHGWDGRRLGYLDHIKPRHRYQLARGPWNGCKFELMGHYRFFLCFGNYRGSIGYVSEKIHEVLQARCVPIYLGDQSIHTRVPAEAYIDARRATAFRQLILDLKAMSCRE